jgi:hypothetical protein
MPDQRVAGVDVAAQDRREAASTTDGQPPPRGARARRPAQPVSAARPPVDASEGRPEAPPRTGARPWAGYTIGSGLGLGIGMMGSGN